MKKRILAEIENPLSLNYYVYCEGNPVGYIDPSGKVRQKTKNIESYESPAGGWDWGPGSGDGGTSSKGGANTWSKTIRGTQDIIPGTNIPK